MARCTVTLKLDVEYDDEYTEPERLTYVLDHILGTALSTVGVMDEEGEISISEFYVSKPDGPPPVITVLEDDEEEEGPFWEKPEEPEWPGPGGKL